MINQIDKLYDNQIAQTNENEIKFFKNLRIKLVLSKNYVYNISMNNYIYTGEKL